MPEPIDVGDILFQKTWGIHYFIIGIIDEEFVMLAIDKPNREANSRVYREVGYINGEGRENWIKVA